MSEDRDPISALLRASGRRPAVPEETEHRARAASRAVWKAEVARLGLRRRQRMAAMVMAAAAVITLGVALWLLFPAAGGAPGFARVEQALGRAEVWHAESPGAVPLAAGDEITTGRRLGTGLDGGLALRLESGHALRMAPETRLVISAEGNLRLEAGALYIDSRGSPGDLVLDTPLGTVRDIGTRYQVRLSREELLVHVREGRVRVDVEEGTHEVAAGEESRTDRGGETSIGAAPIYGEPWAWLEPVGLPMEIDGRSLGEFLDWYIRERGLTMDGSAVDDLGSARGLTLTGSISGMTLDEALVSVLATCNLEHRQEEGILLIFPGADPAREP